MSTKELRSLVLSLVSESVAMSLPSIVRSIPSVSRARILSALAYHCENYTLINRGDNTWAVID